MGTYKDASLTNYDGPLTRSMCPKIPPSSRRRPAIGHFGSRLNLALRGSTGSSNTDGGSTKGGGMGSGGCNGVGAENGHGSATATGGAHMLGASLVTVSSPSLGTLAGGGMGGVAGRRTSGTGGSGSGSNGARDGAGRPRSDGSQDIVVCDNSSPFLPCTRLCE